MQERTWTTSALPAHEQFPYWNDVVWDAFAPVQVSRAGDGPFRGSVQGGRIGPFGVFSIRSQAQAVARTAPLVSDAPGDVCFLNLPLTGGTFAAQAGREARLRAGDFALVDGTRPFELGFGSDFSQLSIVVPLEQLQPVLARPQSYVAVPVAGDRGMGAIVVSTLRSLAERWTTLDRHDAARLTDWLPGMIALALGSAAPAHLTTNRGLMLQAALDEIERSLADPMLSPPVVAQRIGVSTRYLHQLFSDQGSTFGRWLLARRLDRCRADLADPAQRSLRIADIAARRGLYDAAHFSRVFRARFGCTPSEVRRSLAGAGPLRQRA